MKVGPALRHAVHAWQVSDESPEAFDGIERAISEGIWEKLVSLGIKSFDGTGAPRSTPRAAQHCVQLRPPTPARHLLS